MPAGERVLVFVPMYNCEAQIGRVLARFDDRATACFQGLIVVNNRSTDGGESVAADAVQRLRGVEAAVLRNDENYGLGGSHKVAFAYAIEHGFDHVVVLHGDDQGQFSDLVPRLEAGEHREVDCLLGARFHPGSELPGYSAFRTYGNIAFDALFSMVTGKRLYDLGSGLNLYRVDVLRDGFYERFPDDLTFNYCMILAHVALGHRFRFFPIVWREEDQVSNVRLFSQARRVLGLLARYRLGPMRFLRAEHRSRPRAGYTAQVVARNGSGEPPDSAR